MQYIYVRTKSILDSSNFILSAKDIDININILLNDESIDIVKNIYAFEDVLKNVTDKNEPYLLSRYLIELAKNYSAFYNKYKILVDDKNVSNARLYLTYMTNVILEKGASLLGIKMPDKM